MMKQKSVKGWRNGLAAVLYGIAGVLEAARTAGATNNYGNSYRICGREKPLF